MLLTLLLALFAWGTPTTDSCARPLFEQDTLYLEAGCVTAFRNVGTSDNSRYGIGQRNLSFNEKILDNERAQSLSDFLKARTSLYIKEYGNGASAYLSLRGTSSSHTSIDWNGQDLSLPTLGQTDLSHVPLYFFDGLEIHLGGNSSLYGNGSIGGALQLRTTPRWEEGFSGNVLMRGGSFEHNFLGTTLRYNSGRMESKTALFYTGAKNDFTFRNNTRAGHPVETVNNAAYRNYGVLQEFFYRINDQHLLSTGVYYLDFNREIQPSVASNAHPKTYKSIFDNNTKAYLNLQGSTASNTLHYNVRASYSYDDERYEGDVIAAHRGQANVEAEYRQRYFSLKAGTLHLYTLPQVYAYGEGIHEWRNEAYATGRLLPVEGLTLSAGIRYIHVTDVSVPWLPSANLQYEWNLGKHRIQLRGAWAQSTKIPTLNDRYWGGNNVHLLPEISNNLETGVAYHYEHAQWEVGCDLTVYQANVRNWIRWLPIGEIWRPQNLAQVESRGLEANAHLRREYSWGLLGLTADYAYTHVCQTASTRPNDPNLGHQLAYQPQHTANASFEASYRNWLFQLDGHFIGSRTTTDRFELLDPYFLLNTTLRYRLHCFRQPSDLSLTINNLLNTNYQNVLFYAMPGINFQIAWMFRF